MWDCQFLLWGKCQIQERWLPCLSVPPLDVPTGWPVTTATDGCATACARKNWIDELLTSSLSSSYNQLWKERLTERKSGAVQREGECHEMPHLPTTKVGWYQLAKRPVATRPSCTIRSRLPIQAVATLAISLHYPHPVATLLMSKGRDCGCEQAHAHMSQAFVIHFGKQKGGKVLSLTKNKNKYNQH